MEAKEADRGGPLPGGERPVCFCFHVGLAKLAAHIRRRRPRHAAQLAECHGAGTGCGWCRPRLASILEQLARDPAAEPVLPGDQAADSAARDAHRRRAESQVGPAEPLADALD
ncbi:MAG: (2Fe-2S)-binding protein [Candidatus Sumerlaeia bacterium]|nr:(2Fe-2S)-binding protein [Candidatus Sumerlaeia bacterium]